jgi:hypothetical protein
MRLVGMRLVGMRLVGTARHGTALQDYYKFESRTDDTEWITQVLPAYRPPAVYVRPAVPPRRCRPPNSECSSQYCAALCHAQRRDHP